MKKTLQLALAALAVVGMLSTSALAKNYPDVASNHWAYKQIQSLTNEDVLIGYPDGKFKPSESATRAEFANMVVKALHQDKAPLKQTFEFKDVPYKYWAFNTIQRAINLNLLKNNSDNMFRPDDTITKKEAMEIMISALNLNKLGVYNAEKAIGVMQNPDNPISRAEMAYGLYNMQIEARKHPNKKLEECMKKQKGKGVVLRGVTIDGTVATIPAGTTIPVLLMNDLRSDSNKVGDKFLTSVNKALITKEGYVIVAEQSSVNGEITSIKLGKLFVRNGKMGLETQTITTPIEQTADFKGTIPKTQVHMNWFERIVRAIIKNSKVKLKSGKIVKIKLAQPVQVDLTSGWIIQ